MNPRNVTDYRHLDYDPPAWRQQQSVNGHELRPGPIVMLFAVLGASIAVIGGSYLVYRLAGPLAIWIMAGL